MPRSYPLPIIRQLLRMGTLGTPVALTAIAFGIGILIIPFAVDTTGQPLPE